MRRKSNWPRDLAAAIRRMRDTPFEWGVHDCGLAAATVIESITGVDPAAGLRGKYSSAAGSARRLKEVSGGGLEEFAESIAASLGCGEIDVARAGRGDAVLFDTEDGPALGIVDTDGIHAVATGTRGWIRLPVRQCRRAWRV